MESVLLPELNWRGQTAGFMSDERLDEDLLRSLLTRIPVGIALVRSSGKILWSNPACLVSNTEKGPSVTTIRESMDQGNSWPAEVVDKVCKAVEDGTETSVTSVKIHPPHGHGAMFVDIGVSSMGTQGNHPSISLVTTCDVTEHTRESGLSFLLKEYFRTSPYPIQITDSRNYMVAVNPALVRAYGYSSEELIGRRSRMFRSESVPPSFYENMWDELHRSTDGTWSGETITRRKDGVDLPEFLHLVAIRDTNGQVTHYLATVVSISELKKWEQKAAQSEKMASIGQLAAGVAHEINSPLANAMLVIESIRRKSQDEWIKERLDILSTQLEGAAKIIRGLLDFARASDIRMGDVDMISVVKETVGFLRGKVDQDVEIEESYPSCPVPITADRLQLSQVVTNILSNAVDAMEDKGKILVSVKVVGMRAELEIVDHGPGIPEENMQIIFDPFFTTKSEGKGTGLGLAISLGIMQSHHGSISARNVPGAGAGFLVTLPLRKEAPHPQEDLHSSLPEKCKL